MGFISDRFYGKRSPVGFVAVILANIMTYILTFYNTTMSKPVFFISMFFFGMFISGLNNLVQGSCAADLGR